MTRRHLSFLFALAIGCGGTAGTEEQSSTDDSTGATAAVAVSDEGAPVIPESARVPLTEVELLDAGEGERTELRLRAEVGQTERMRMEQVMTMQIQLGSQQVPEVEMPPIQMDFELRTTHIGEDGAMRHESRVIGLEVLGEGPLVPRLEQELAPMRDLSGWDVVDPRGRLVASRYELPANASPELQNSLQRMQDAMRQLMPPLPEAPVGIGAKWRAVSDVRSQIAFRQTSTYTLEAVEEGRIVLSVQTDQSAEPQPMESDQPGVTAELLAFDGEASARIELALDRMVPTSEGSVRVELTTRATPDSGQPQEVTMKMATAVKVSPL